MIFDDEKLFHLDTPDYSSLKYFAPEEESSEEKEKKNWQSVGVWGCIGFEFKSKIHFTQRSMKGDDYRSIL